MPGDPAHRLLIWHWGRRGGGPLFTAHLAEALAADPRFVVFGSFSRQCEIGDRLKAVSENTLWLDTYHDRRSFLRATLRLGKLRRRFSDFLTQNRIETVISTMPHLWNPALHPVIKRHRARYVSVIHDAEPHPGDSRTLHRIVHDREIAAADRIITLSAHARDRLAERRPEGRTRIDTVPHGVFGHDTVAEPRAFPEQRPFRLLFFGRIRPYKGIDLLLGAFRVLRRQRKDVVLHLAGDGDMEPYRTEIETLDGLSLDHRWIADDEITSLMQTHDLLILPYREASQSGVLAFAAGAALPAVATPVGGLPEQIVSGRNGMIAETTTAEALADAINRLLDNPELYQQCSAGAATDAAETLNWHDIARRVGDIVLDG